MFCGGKNKFSFEHGLLKQSENQEVVTQKSRGDGCS